jgi:hypothetical protein
MAISGLQVINIGVQNESIGSDSLYTAFNKVKTNFATLFGNSSPYNTFTGNLGIAVTANSTLGTVDITNTGVLSIIAGTGVTINQANGNVTISSTGGGGNGGGTVTSVGVATASATRLTVSGSPIVSSGTITMDLATTGVTSGTYTYPTLSVDNYGRILSIANAASVGTVTEVGITPGFGIQVTGSPVTTSGNISILNTGVTRLSAGSGISLSGSNGNVTISTATGAGTVTSVGVTSSSLDVTGSPIVNAGTISVEIPANISVTGRLLLSGSHDLANGAAANLSLTATYFSTLAAETGTLAAGTEGLIKTFMMVADSGDMVITVTNAGWKTSGTGTMTFDTIGEGCTLQYINSKWYCIGNNGVVFA